jgi:hypothetical protein
VQLPETDIKPLQGRVFKLEEEIGMSKDKLKLQVASLATGLGTRIGKIETAVKQLITLEAGSSIDKGLESALRASQGEGEDYTQNLENASRDWKQHSLKSISVCAKSWRTMKLSR